MGIVLKRRGLAMGNCFFCTAEMEDNAYRFIQCPIASQIWSYMSRLGGMRGMRLSNMREQEHKQDHKIINDK